MLKIGMEMVFILGQVILQINLIGVKKMGCNGTLTNENETNCSVDQDGLYYLQVDTGARTYSTTLMSLGLIGFATPTGWDSDTDLVYMQQTMC